MQVQVGTVIRQRWEPGLWREGVVARVWKKQGASRVCQVKYDSQESTELPVDDELEVWVAAQTVWDLCNKKKKKDVQPIQLFIRTGSKKSKPYSLDQFLELLQYSCQALGGLSLEDLEGHRLVKTMSMPTEVYGRMLPQAIDVSCSFRLELENIFGYRWKIFSDTSLLDFFFDTRKFSGSICICKPIMLWSILGTALGTRTFSSSRRMGQYDFSFFFLLFFLSSLIVAMIDRCMQAAYTIGCKTKGIECHKNRNNVAQNLALRLEDAAHVHKTRDHMVCC